MKNKFYIAKYFSDVKDEETKNYIDKLMSKYSVHKVVYKTNGIPNDVLSVEMLKMLFEEENRR